MLKSGPYSLPGTLAESEITYFFLRAFKTAWAKGFIFRLVKKNEVAALVEMWVIHVHENITIPRCRRDSWEL